MKTPAFVLLCLALASPVRAAQHHVPAGFPTIQGALNACAAGDTVIVQPGVYFENISWPAVPSINLLSAGDSSNTSINGNGAGRVMEFASQTVDTNTVITGFTLTGGYVSGSSAQGAGIRISGASPKFRNMRITGNHLNAGNWGYGAGIYCNNSSAVFEHTAIVSNATDSASWGYGGGAYLAGNGHPVFRNVLISGNSVRSDSWNYGTGVYCKSSDATFENVSIANNVSGDSASWYYGTGLYIDDCTAELVNVLVQGNSQGNGGFYYYGAGIYLRQTSGVTNVTMTHVTVVENYRNNNGSINGAGVYANSNTSATIVNSICWNTNAGMEIDGPGSVSATYSNVRGGVPGAGNINAMPLFTSISDFHLLPSSPGIDAGLAAGAPPFDLDNHTRPLPAGSNPDLGCYETDQAVGVSTPSTGGWAVFPNPSSGFVYIHVPDVVNETVYVQLADLAGRKIWSDEFHGPGPHEVNVSRMQKGMYVIRLSKGSAPGYDGKLLVR